MSGRTLIAIASRLVIAAGILIVGCTLGLPLIAALPDHVAHRPPLWGFLAPLVGAVAALALLLHRSHAIRRGGWPGSAANLPAQFVLLFIITGMTGVVGGALLERDVVTVQRPAVVLLCGPALVVAVGLVLRALVQPVLVAELTRLAPRDRKDRRQGPLSAVGVFAIRPTLTMVATAVVSVSLALVGGHAYSLAQLARERSADVFLDDVRQVVAAQLQQVPPSRAERFLSDYPSRHDLVVIALDRAGQPTADRAGFTPEQPIRAAGPGRCRTDRVFRCAMGAGFVVLDPQPVDGTDATLGALASRLGLIALGFFIFAVLLSWAVGHDISRDFQVIVNQLRAMARQDRLDLGRPVTVTSIDEVGDLTAGLGKLRARLEQELDEHQKSLRKVREADRTKNEFFSNVSLELRTPLTTLSGYSQLLLDGSEGELSTNQQEDVQSIYRGGQQLLGLVNDVIDISVIESGHLQLSPEDVDLAPLCRELVQAQTGVLEAEQRHKEVTLRAEIDDDLPPFRADRRRLIQVIQNLLSNALKFTEKGSVTLSVKRQGEQVAIAVQDTGVGIGQLDLARVFDSFRQVGELSARRRGSGLGLAIARRLVELHGGTITVESELDRGSTFTVLLPREGPP